MRIIGGPRAGRVPTSKGGSPQRRGPAPRSCAERSRVRPQSGSGSARRPAAPAPPDPGRVGGCAPADDVDPGDAVFSGYGGEFVWAGSHPRTGSAIRVTRPTPCLQPARLCGEERQPPVDELRPHPLPRTPGPRRPDDRRVGGREQTRRCGEMRDGFRWVVDPAASTRNRTTPEASRSTAARCGPASPHQAQASNSDPSCDSHSVAAPSSSPCAIPGAALTTSTSARSAWARTHPQGGDQACDRRSGGWIRPGGVLLSGLDGQDR